MAEVVSSNLTGPIFLLNFFSSCVFLDCVLFIMRFVFRDNWMCMSRIEIKTSSKKRRRTKIKKVFISHDHANVYTIVTVAWTRCWPVEIGVDADVSAAVATSL